MFALAAIAQVGAFERTRYSGNFPFGITNQLGLELAAVHRSGLIGRNECDRNLILFYRQHGRKRARSGFDRNISGYVVAGFRGNEKRQRGIAFARLHVQRTDIRTFGGHRPCDVRFQFGRIGTSGGIGDHFRLLELEHGIDRIVVLVVATGDEQQRQHKGGP